MGNFIIAVLIMGGVSFYVGLYYFFMFLRRRKNKEHIFFTICCFAVTLYDIFCAGLYSAASVSQGLWWQKGQFASLNIITLGLMWFCYYIFPGISRKLLVFVTIIFCLLLLLGLFINNELTVSELTPQPKVIELNSGLVITYNESDPGLIYLIQYICMVGGFTLFLILCIKSIRKTKERYNIALIIALAIFYPAAINDVLVGAGVYPFIYVLEYVYLFIIFSMAYILLNRFVNLQNAVEYLNKNLELQVEERTRELKDARDALWGEMQLAKKIQTTLLPKNPRVRDHEIAAYMHPIDEVGGDYYDIINVDGWDWLIIGDVSGHGVVAGLIMMMVETAVKSVLHQQAKLSATRLLEIVNGVLIENLKLMGEDRYMTITALAYREKGVFHFSGMHQDILVFRAKENKVESIETLGIWLGVQGISLPDLKDIKLILAPGDTMLLYTDGITEARNPEKKMFEKKRLIKILQDYGHGTVQEMKSAILDALDGYTQSDDLTFMIVRKTNS